MAVEQFSVAVQGDFVAAQTRAKPIAALAELIWNGLDADATSIDVELVHDNLVGGGSRALSCTTMATGSRVKMRASCSAAWAALGNVPLGEPSATAA